MSYNYQDRQNILGYSSKYGIQNTIEALGLHSKTINRATIYRWRKTLKTVKQTQGCTTEYTALNPKSTKPKNYRSSKIPSIYIEFIKLYRKKRFGVGKDKLATVINQARTNLDYAMELKAEYNLFLYNLPPISPSTIGRILTTLKNNRSIHRTAKEYNKHKQVYLHGGTGQIKYRKPINRNTLYGVKKNRKPKDYKPDKVGELIQLDAVTIQTRILNPKTGIASTKKLYFVCGIDLVSRLAYSRTYTTLNSASTTDFIQRFNLKLTHLTKQKITIQAIQTDNGQENHKHFTTHLNKHKITQYWNYPRSPKMNAFVEKFNHTVQAECIEYHAHLLATCNLQQFTQKLEEWTHWYNTQRPHSSLQQLSPLQYFKQELQKL